MTIETPEELEAMERVGALVADVLAEMRAAVAPGITTGALDAIAARAFRRAGATSGPAELVGFPGRPASRSTRRSSTVCPAVGSCARATS